MVHNPFKWGGYDNFEGGHKLLTHDNRGFPKMYLKKIKIIKCMVYLCVLCKCQLDV